MLIVDLPPTPDFKLGECVMVKTLEFMPLDPTWDDDDTTWCLATVVSVLYKGDSWFYYVEIPVGFSPGTADTHLIVSNDTDIAKL